jgi:hypothetical protein
MTSGGASTDARLNLCSSSLAVCAMAAEDEYWVGDFLKGSEWARRGSREKRRSEGRKEEEEEKSDMAVMRKMIVLTHTFI